MLAIDNWILGFARPIEDCVFDKWGGRCVFCNQKHDLTMRQWHPGYEITFTGTFEIPEYHDLNADVWSELRLPGGDFSDIPLVVTACKQIRETRWRYSFQGTKFLERSFAGHDETQGRAT